jgi:hypothetical protein
MTPERQDDKEEVAQRGTDIYQRLVKPQLRPEDRGQLVAIDIDSGAFEVADAQLAIHDASGHPHNDEFVYTASTAS